MSLTGAQVKAVLEQQFNDAGAQDPAGRRPRETYDRTRAAGDRITGLTLPDGTAVDPAATYTVALNCSWRRAATGSRCSSRARGDVRYGTDIDALEHYVESLAQPFTAPDPAAAPRITTA